MGVESDLRVGQRIDHEGHRGSVKYVGPVPPTRGVWLGVDWDDPERGKHDGCSKDGTRFFTAEFTTSGSFIRPQMVSAGSSFMHEITERYGRVEDSAGGVIEEEMYVRGGGKHKAVEVVGASKVNLQQSHFDRLTEIGLRHTLLSSAGPPGVIASSLPNIRELDVSSCLLPSWEELIAITSQLPKLQILNTSQNRLGVQFDQSTDAFRSVCTLFMNRMRYNWSEVLDICQMFPSLKCLHVCFNQISSLSGDISVLSELTLLNLESNQIADWSQIASLGRLQKLSTLIINDTHIDRIEFRDTAHTEKTKSFPSLNSLSISNNKISQWSSINELNKLDKLTELLCRKNPFMSEDSYADRYLILAKVANLKLLARSTVEAEERKGAEVDYIKKFGLAWKAAGGHQEASKNKPSDAFCCDHPRYQELIDKYGAAEDSELKIGSSALKNNLINVTVRCPDDASKKELKKRVPLTMTVQKLKVLVQRLYRVNVHDLKLSYISTEMADKEIEFENDGKEINYYSVMEGDTVLVRF